MSGDPSGDPSKFGVFYALPMLSGRAKLTDIQNGRYPDIRPTTLREYLATATI